MNEHQIKGTVLLSRLNFLRQRASTEKISVVLSKLPEEDVTVLAGMILPVAWYPAALAFRFDEAIVATLSSHDAQSMFVAMGEASAEENLGEHQASFLEPGVPHHVLSHAPTLYRLYHSSGRTTYERTGPTSALIRTSDALQASYADCLTTVGWFKRAIELSGGKEVRVTHEHCAAKGAPNCEFACSWCC